MRNDSSFLGFSLIKGVLCALATALFLTVIFASILRVASLSAQVVYPVNQGIKTVSVALGVFFCVRGEKGWLKGGIIGLVFTMLSYLVFSAIGGDFSLTWLLILELGLGCFSGALCGVIAVNLLK